MNLAGRLLKIAESYLEFPEEHIAAASDPALFGGPYIDVPIEQWDEMRALTVALRTQRTPLVDMAHGIKALEDALVACRGEALGSIYSLVPSALRGMVELGYDSTHRASARYIESLVYRSSINCKDAQGVALWNPNVRPSGCGLSKPLLAHSAVHRLPWSYRSPELDLLLRSGEQGVLERDIGDLFGSEPSRLLTLFEDRPRSAPPASSGVRCRYLGHACILVESGKDSVLIDPVLGYDEFCTLSHLPARISVVLITHGHHDHFVPEALLRLRDRVERVIVPRASGTLQDPSLLHALRELGFGHVEELDECASTTVGELEVTLLPMLGEHGDLHVRGKAGYYVRAATESFVFLADAAAVDVALYDLLRSFLGAPTRLFLGMECEGAPVSWLYGALMTQSLRREFDDGRRLAGSNADAAMAITRAWRPGSVFVYAMALEPWLSFMTGKRYGDQSPALDEVETFCRSAREMGLPARLLREPECL